MNKTRNIHAFIHCVALVILVYFDVNWHSFCHVFRHTHHFVVDICFFPATTASVVFLLWYWWSRATRDMEDEDERERKKWSKIYNHNKKSGWSVKTVFIVVHYIYWTNTKNAQRWQNCLTFNGNRKKGQQKIIRWKMAKSIKKKRQKNKSENCRFAKRKSNLYIRIYLSQLPICFHLFHWLPTGCDLAATSIQFAGSCVTIFWGPLCFDMSFYSLLFAYQKSLDCYYNNILLLDVGNDNLLNKSCNIIVWIWME